MGLGNSCRTRSSVHFPGGRMGGCLGVRPDGSGPLALFRRARRELVLSRGRLLC